MKYPKMLVGEKYGKLEILNIAERRKGQKFWNCKCDCGNTKEIVESSIRNGNTSSCGCGMHPKKHGLARHPLYSRWFSMMARVYKKDNQDYSRYGGRGIDVCERWHDVKNYIDDIYPAFKKGLELDRIDNNKGYSPKNCHWVTPSENSNNMSRNRIVEYRGKIYTMAQIVRLLGMKYSTLLHRLDIGWSSEKAIETPVKGKTYSIKI